MSHKLVKAALLSIGASSLIACTPSVVDSEATTAHGAPGQAPTWAYSAKTGIGTSYEQYVESKYTDNAATGTVSRIWFSVAEGVLTETMVGLIHQAQLKDSQFVITGNGFTDIESQDTTSKIGYLHTDSKGRPLSLAYRIVNRDREGRYSIEKHLVTDPDRNTLLQRVIFTAHEPGIRAHLVTNPHIANTGGNDEAWVADGIAYAREGNQTMAIAGPAAAEVSVGFVGTSDLITDLADGTQNWRYTSTGESSGNVSITQSLATNPGQPQRWNFAYGFGSNPKHAADNAQASLAAGFDRVLAHYNGEGEHIGWEDYMASLAPLEQLAQMATDGGKLAYTSAMVLKAQEDKTHAGALIASLSNPWGDVVSAAAASTGYKAVWPRDFYQVAMAFLALGDTQTPKVAFEYLTKVQAGAGTPGFTGTPGWFLQKTHVDGTLEWYSVQLDQTAMPIMLGYKLWQQGVLSDSEARNWYQTMLKPAAQFLSHGGEFSLGWNQTSITPPFTQQERWEEQEGYSPSTTAAIITGLVAAAEFAQQFGSSDDAELYLTKADEYREQLQARTFTTEGTLPGDGDYYLRISRNDNPNDQGQLIERNGQGALNESDIVDPGFLELVRYGVHRADFAPVRESLNEVDNLELPEYLQVKYEFPTPDATYVGWRRYGGDGYGERTSNGAGYGHGGEMHSDQRGRVWPFLTGERAHYELAHSTQTGNTNMSALQNQYVASMEYFANEGLMLPEQVWDGVGSNATYGYELGEGTNSATPLAWTHAEYIKLLRSLSDAKVWDYYPPVGERYQSP
ncbi:glycoside hydrolase family 15 protein [Gilvimarinus sp. SDUM040013]|uniref:Glycoside hydrolase family 15 protein n=1 Tax=Gilvimarinus gilvus TaxID=3058038 RepID=A0ABU4S1N0_9GAMM|nr:glycoside hydrolase family 15 protein [Gilvimarinus sp. SDUM040013]MDO3384449.1 glycoside hydrolase family 15 protein [Gilvimarinus sp. SDUM040013]MDX6851082.1 glycoside hydrolase family 15 protein [Gilvimarinus sp. SDUM040013]